MVLNNFRKDIKMICEDEHITQIEMGKKAGMAQNYLSDSISGKRNIIVKSFVELLESNGYDLEIRYVKREQK